MKKEPSFRGSEMLVHTGGAVMEEQSCLHHGGSEAKKEQYVQKLGQILVQRTPHTL